MSSARCLNQTKSDILRSILNIIIFIKSFVLHFAKEIVVISLLI